MGQGAGDNSATRRTRRTRGRTLGLTLGRTLGRTRGRSRLNLRWLQSIAPALFAVAMGVTLTVMAVPRLLAGLAIEPHDSLLIQLSKGQGVEGPRLLEAARDYETSLELFFQSDAAAELSTVYTFMAAQFPEGSEAQRLYLQRSVAAARNAVAAAPGQAFTWARLALAHAQLEGKSEAARRALVASMKHSEWQPRLALLRAGLGLTFWTELDGEERRLVQTQIRMAADKEPARLAAAVPSPALWLVVEEALVDYPALAERMQQEREKL